MNAFPLTKILSEPFRTVLHSVLDLPMDPLIFNLPLDPLIFIQEHQPQPKAVEKADLAPSGIHRLEAVSLGGLDQWILIRGHEVERPLALFLHGGPGLPWMPFHPINKELEEYFTVVHWDQRGAGKSYHPDIPETAMSVEQLISDTCQLIELLCKRFHRKSLYLIGFSCGSVLGLNAVLRIPERIKAYVGVGQVACMAESEAISYRYARSQARQHANIHALKELEAIGPPPYRDHMAMLVERKWLSKFGGFFHDRMSSLRFYQSAFGTSE